MRSSRAKGVQVTQDPRQGNVSGATFLELPEPELGLAVGVDAAGVPGRGEDDVDGDVRLPERDEALLHFLRYWPGGRASFGGERHADRDLRLVDLDAVDQSEVVDVDRDLRVVALADRAHDLRLADRAAAEGDAGD